MDLFWSDELPAEPWNRQTSLLVHPLTGGLQDLWIDYHRGSVADVVDKHPALHPNLGRCKSYAWGVVHRLDHVLRETHERAVDVVDLTRSLPEHRVAEDADLVGRHSPMLPRSRDFAALTR